jgi:KUP system potassium uptake protein
MSQTNVIADQQARSAHNDSLWKLSLAAVGVVYGDIGTSPLYTMKEIFGGVHPLATSTDNVLGILSLVFWSLIIVVSIKYVAFIMRADNRGEGGIMALIALARRATPAKGYVRWILMTLGIFGAALFYGDGIITPAISVMSAVEGLEVATPGLASFVVPTTLVILTALFMIQRRGTGNVGTLFGPIMVLWFISLAALGTFQVIQQPAVLAAVNPIYAVHFFGDHGIYGFLVLGSVVLAVTGGEALYADMGHFGSRPIRRAWFSFVLPALLLNYFGQGALLISNPAAAAHPFYSLVPAEWLFVMVGLATAATVIASQAVISGAFSVTRQAIQLGYWPRMEVMHTSEREIGQVYVPLVNWTLFAGVVALVLGFQSSTNLAAAYGIAVTGTMAIDTILAFFVVWALWKWRLPVVIVGALLFLAVDLAFFAANTTKIVHGGWFPLVVGIVVFALMSTWKRGRQLLRERMRQDSVELNIFLTGLIAHPPHRVPGTAVFLTPAPDRVPHALLHNLLHNKVLHERVVLLTVITEEVPYVPEIDRVEIARLQESVYRLTVRYGFKDEPNIPRALELCEALGMTFNVMETSFFLSRETLIATRMPGMALWRERLFVSMARNAGSAVAFFKIPTNRVVELGTQIEL